LLVTLTPVYNPAYAVHVYALLNDEPHAMNALEASYSERHLGVPFHGRMLSFCRAVNNDDRK